MTAARARMAAVLKIKTQFWERLPWLLAGLAHHDASTVQLVSSKCLQAWHNDSRDDAHHPLTLAFMTRPHYEHVLALSTGQPLALLPLPFQQMVAKLAFIPVAETTIEAKHARVSHAKGIRQVGAVTVSLANRLPMLQQWLDRGLVSIEEVLEQFTRARSTTTAPLALGLAAHPGLQGTANAHGTIKKPSSRTIRDLLVGLCYQCDISCMNQDLRAARAVDRKAKRQAASRALAMSDRKPKREPPATTELLLSALSFEHFLEVVEVDAVYSFENTSMQLSTLDATL
eukprot:6463862-Amphidinium_carterae.1